MLKKQSAKNEDICKVTFVFPRYNHAETVQLVGDFNQWDEKATPMKSNKILNVRGVIFLILKITLRHLARLS